jgi:resuscitation-promoting factor RpfB
MTHRPAARSRRPYGAAGLALAATLTVTAATAPAGCDLDTDGATTSSSSSGGNRSVGKRMAAKKGWTGRQWSCLLQLWTKESGWRTHADNPTSSAYGIPQALPGRKMRSAGRDWRTNPKTQIKWGLGYIKGRYGTPCSAWSFHRAHNWY